LYGSEWVVSYVIAILKVSGDEGCEERSNPVHVIYRLYKYGKRSTGGANHGKKPRKFNLDCTICHSCREAVIVSDVLEWQENRVE